VLPLSLRPLEKLRARPDFEDLWAGKKWRVHGWAGGFFSIGCEIQISF
jgi:hypothetical protein